MTTCCGWLDALRARGLTTGTIRTRWRGLRRFVNWLVAEDILAKDPLAGIVVDKPEPPPVPILTDEELTALVNACKGKAFNDLRDAAVIRLLIDCGLRVSELTGIDIKDLDLDGESVRSPVRAHGCGWPTSATRPGWRWIATCVPAVATATPPNPRCSSGSVDGSLQTVCVNG